MSSRRLRYFAALVAWGTLALPPPTGQAHAVRVPAAGASACGSMLTFGLIPAWARAGFSDNRPHLPRALGRRGEIVAISFSGKLFSPPSRTINNKLLWVARRPHDSLSDLHISAQWMAGPQRLGRPVSRVVSGGPGPSTIDLPHAGCWRLTLAWSGRQDTLDLRYAKP